MIKIKTNIKYCHQYPSLNFLKSGATFANAKWRSKYIPTTAIAPPKSQIQRGSFRNTILSPLFSWRLISWISIASSPVSPLLSSSSFLTLSTYFFTSSNSMSKNSTSAGFHAKFNFLFSEWIIFPNLRVVCFSLKGFSYELYLYNSNTLPTVESIRWRPLSNIKNKINNIETITKLCHKNVHGYLLIYNFSIALAYYYIKSRWIPPDLIYLPFLVTTKHLV